MTTKPIVTQVGNGMFRIEHDGGSQLAYVAGSLDDQWLFWNGQVFRQPFHREASGSRRQSTADVHHSLSAPMPATVLKVLVEAGASVQKGETLLILEAMKMELPVRSNTDAVVRSVLCRVGELVQPGTVLVELE